jgi:hypothetical protein
MKPTYKSMIALVLTTILVAGCLGGTSSSSSTPDAVGDWEKDGGTTIELFENGSIAEEDGWIGAWSINGDVFIFHCSDEVCENNMIERHYHFAVQDDVLFLEIFEEIHLNNDGEESTSEAWESNGECKQWVSTSAINANTTVADIRASATPPDFCTD